MKQELIDIVFTSLVVFLFCLSVSLLLISFGWKGWLLRGGLAKLSQLKLWHHFEQGRLGKGKIPSAMVLLFGLPLHVFVVCCWGGKIVPLRAWSKSSLTLISLLRLSSLSPLVVIWANGFVVVCCCWGGRVVVLCTCLLLPGCKVWLRLFSEGWAPVPPLPSLLSLLLLGVSLSICSWGGSACSSANLGAKYLQKIMFSPLYAVFSILCHYFLCSLPLPLFLQGWKGCLLTTGVVSIYLIVVDGKQWALKGRLGKVLSAMALPLRSFKHVLHFNFPVLVFVCSRWVGRVVQ